MKSLSIVLPAKDEAESLRELLPRIKTCLPAAEILVIDDGSIDSTVSVCVELGIKVISHPYSKGNGAAIKTGAREAGGEIICFMDADSQHDPAHISSLLDMMDKGYDMVVVARDKEGQASKARFLGNRLYNGLASYMTGQKILDLTSGFRVVNAEKFRQFLSLLPNGFSYPTTITMAFFRAGYSVGYVKHHVAKRVGKSHVNLVKDGVRFLLIIFKIGTLYSPLKLFAPIALFHFVLGAGYYMYTYIEFHRFTNMSALLFTTSVIVFLIGLVSEQITNLVYSKNTD